MLHNNFCVQKYVRNYLFCENIFEISRILVLRNNAKRNFAFFLISRNSRNSAKQFLFRIIFVFRENKKIDEIDNPNINWFDIETKRKRSNLSKFWLVFLINLKETKCLFFWDKHKTKQIKLQYCNNSVSKRNENIQNCISSDQKINIYAWKGNILILIKMKV